MLAYPIPNNRSMAGSCYKVVTNRDLDQSEPLFLVMSMVPVNLCEARFGMHRTLGTRNKYDWRKPIDSATEGLWQHPAIQEELVWKR